MKQSIHLSIDVTKIDKAKLYQGKKGTYLDAVLFLNDEADQYDNHGMIVQSVTKEEREAGTRGAILGNARKFGQQTESSTESTQEETKDDLPF